MLKVLKFGDRQKGLDRDISAGVTHRNSSRLIGNPNYITQHEIQIDDQLPTDEDTANDDSIDDNNAIEINDDTNDFALNNNINNVRN